MLQVTRLDPASWGYPDFTFQSTQPSAKPFVAEGLLGSTGLQSPLTHLLLLVLSIVLGVPL